ncbi:5810_t:CDS:1, partial [Cetraspora pellucida]
MSNKKTLFKINLKDSDDLYFYLKKDDIGYRISFYEVHHHIKLIQIPEFYQIEYQTIDDKIKKCEQGIFLQQTNGELKIPKEAETIRILYLLDDKRL